jgi:hypothetical protein
VRPGGVDQAIQTSALRCPAQRDVGPTGGRPGDQSAAASGRHLRNLYSYSTGPYGSKPILYADYAASGRPLARVERFVQDFVLPKYANTHTETSGERMDAKKVPC